MKVRSRLWVALSCFFTLALAACAAPVVLEPPLPADLGFPTKVAVPEGIPAPVTPPAKLAMAFQTPTPAPTLQATPRPNGAPNSSEMSPDDPGERAAKKNAVAPTPIVQSQFLLPTIDPARLTGLAVPPKNRVRVGSAPRIALTFDTGAGAPIVRMILAELKEAQVKATFFIVGNWAQKNGDLVRQIAADGHDLGNHSFNHPNFTTLSDEQMIAQVTLTEDIVHQITGCTTRPFFRAPYGALNPGVLRTLGLAGFESIFWSSHGGDWLPGTTVDTVRATVEKTAGNGGIIVLHSSVPETAQAVPQIIQDLRARGLEFVRLSELLAPDAEHPYRPPCQLKP